MPWMSPLLSAPSMDHVSVESVSTSAAASDPVTEGEPESTSPLSRVPASVTEPAAASAELTTTGVSLAPVIWIVIC